MLLLHLKDCLLTFYRSKSALEIIPCDEINIKNRVKKKKERKFYKTLEV
jgi:hypothetical protein